MTIFFSRHPVDTPHITGYFGQDYGGYQHRGVDYGENEGEPIYAPAEGYASWFQNDGSFGIGVCIDHGADQEFRYTLYAHMSETDVEIGDWISNGELIGKVGQTGEAYGAHLHWQYCKSNQFPRDISQSTDPLLYISGGDDVTKEEVLAMINEMKSNGDLVSSTDTLELVGQIIGSKPNTYSDVAAVDAVRDEVFAISQGEGGHVRASTTKFNLKDATANTAFQPKLEPKDEKEAPFTSTTKNPPETPNPDVFPRGDEAALKDAERPKPTPQAKADDKAEDKPTPKPADKK